MPMVHIADRAFYAATVRSDRFSRFDTIFHEGPAPGCTSDPSPPSWRFVSSLAGASPSALLLEFSWIFFMAGPLALGNSICRRRGVEPLALQPEPFCAGASGHKPRFVSTDSTGIGETLVAIGSLGRADPRAERMLTAFLAAVPDAGDRDRCSNSSVSIDSASPAVLIPWGIAHAGYIERRLLSAGFQEESEAREHVVCSWFAFIVVHLCVWSWWWCMHAAIDSWIMWRQERRLAIRMPMWWLWGATLHLGPQPVSRSIGHGDEPASGPSSLIPPDGALRRWWSR